VNTWCDTVNVKKDTMRTPLTAYMRITSRYVDNLSSTLIRIRTCRRNGCKSKGTIFGWSMHVFKGKSNAIRQTWYMV